jgi:hypothetical protein
MIAALQIAVRRAHFGLIRTASLVVPAWNRSEWVQEWQAELWYMMRECFSQASPDPRSIWQATAFCLGAYRDAFCLRVRSWRRQRCRSRTQARIRGSPSFCLLLLIALLFSAWGIARISRRVAAGMSRVQVYPWQPTDEHTAPCDCALDLAASRRSLEATQQFFDGFAHYSIAQETVSGPNLPRSKWTIVHAGSDFFAVLHLPVRVIDSSKGFPRIVLSRERWMHDYRNNPDIAGTRLHVGSVDAVVAGIAFGNSMGLPGNADAWVLDYIPRAPTGGQEFVAGHLSPTGYFDDGRWTLSLCGILLALLALPFITSPAVGGYRRGSPKPPLSKRSRFWAFLLVRIAIVLAIAYYASADLAFSLLKPFSQLSGCLQCGSAFVICLVSMSWVFRDQKRRCPVCLRQMAYAVEVGETSRTFLAWNGTELLCVFGHTLLHIPGSPTSWFSARRWVCLDRSWQFLFLRSG